MTKLIETSNARIQGAPSQRDGGSTGGFTVHITAHRVRRALVVVTALMCLVLILLPTYTGVAFAQEQTGEEDLVDGVAINLNAYWEEQFRLLGYPYSPAKVAFLYDHELVLGPCGLAFTGLGPGYCPYDGTLYYPIDWVDPTTGLSLEEYGESAVEMVVAHEMAHHAQMQMQRFGVLGVESIPGTMMELEADCLAGAYANRGIAGPESIEAALAALGEAGGPGHGTSQQRVAAFELGYSTGDPARCLSLGDTSDATTQDGDSGVM